MFIDSSVLISMSELKVEHWDSEKDGEFNEENMAKKLKLQGYSCEKKSFPCGAVSPSHSHDATKKDAILSGQLKFTTSGREVILQPGDILDIPIGMIHIEAVIGNDTLILYDATKL